MILRFDKIILKGGFAELSDLMYPNEFDFGSKYQMSIVENALAEGIPVLLEESSTNEQFGLQRNEQGSYYLVKIDIPSSLVP